MEAAGSDLKKSKNGRRTDTSGIGSRPACGTAGRVPGRPGRKAPCAANERSSAEDAQPQFIRSLARPKPPRLAAASQMSDAAPNFRRRSKHPTPFQASDAASSILRRPEFPTPLQASNAAPSIRRRSRAFKAIPTHTRQTEHPVPSRLAAASLTSNAAPGIRRCSKHPTPPQASNATPGIRHHSGSPATKKSEAPRRDASLLLGIGSNRYSPRAKRL